jgi:fido (protein-threonine AMPylation protein)
MEPTLNPEFFSIENREFYEKYFELLINRVTHATMELESDLGNANDSKNAIRMRDNMKAFTYLIQNLFNDKELDTQVIVNVANMINKSSPFVLNGYRTVGAPCIVDSEVPISKAANVAHDMECLVENYNTLWNDMDPYEKEAMFHIGFIRIHPFEDGNGRTGRLLLNFNLFRQGLAPVVLTKDMESIYHQYIKDFDEVKMGDLFRSQSIKEREIMEDLFQEFQESKKTL